MINCQFHSYFDRDISCCQGVARYVHKDRPIAYSFRYRYSSATWSHLVILSPSPRPYFSEYLAGTRCHEHDEPRPPDPGAYDLLACDEHRTAFGPGFDFVPLSPDFPLTHDLISEIVSRLAKSYPLDDLGKQ